MNFINSHKFQDIQYIFDSLNGNFYKHKEKGYFCKWLNKYIHGAIFIYGKKYRGDNPRDFMHKSHRPRKTTPMKPILQPKPKYISIVSSNNVGNKNFRKDK